MPRSRTWPLRRWAGWESRGRYREGSSQVARRPSCACGTPVAELSQLSAATAYLLFSSMLIGSPLPTVAFNPEVLTSVYFDGMGT
jgi:hypothetical protein